jgi:virginiamycin B lyase
VTAFTHPDLGAPVDIALGSDGNLWLTDILADRIGRITPTGDVTSFT